MDTTTLAAKFARVGTRFKVTDPPARRFGVSNAVRVNVREDRTGEFFELLRPRTPPAVEVLDLHPDSRHLLLLIREGDIKSKLLCGHDERHWFVAGIPEAAPVGTVRQAKEALKPAAVRAVEAIRGVPSTKRDRRKNAAFVRQGEWFFVPEPDFAADERLVLHWEPLRRGNGGKPHWTEWLYRTGGEQVTVCSRHPNGVTPSRYAAILTANPKAKTWGWRAMRRNPGVYVRGRVRHADHATITLPDWHRVLMNTEGESRAMRNVAFLD